MRRLKSFVDAVEKIRKKTVAAERQRVSGGSHDAAIGSGDACENGGKQHDYRSGAPHKDGSPRV